MRFIGKKCTFKNAADVTAYYFIYSSLFFFFFILFYLVERAHCYRSHFKQFTTSISNDFDNIIPLSVDIIGSIDFRFSHPWRKTNNKKLLENKEKESWDLSVKSMCLKCALYLTHISLKSNKMELPTIFIITTYDSETKICTCRICVLDFFTHTHTYILCLIQNQEMKVEKRKKKISSHRWIWEPSQNSIRFESKWMCDVMIK